MIQSRKIFLLYRREDVMTINQNSFIAGEMISRKQMLEMGMPIGSPHLPPFNRREMPFAPLTAAFAGVAAATTVATTALAVVNAVAVVAMYAGAAMTITGMITGDKSLMKMGAIVGLAGGVGSLAAGGIASLAAGGEFAMGTAGIQSANAANAAATASQAAASNIAAGVGSSALGNVGAVTNPATAGMANAGATTGLHGAGGNLAQGMIGKTGIITNTGNMVAGTGTGTLGNIGNQFASGMLQPNFSGVGVEALGSSSTIGNITGQVAGQSAAASGGFFGKLMDSMTPKDWIIAGGTAVATGAKAVSANQANATAQQKYEYDRAVKNRQIANLNDVPTLSNGSLSNSSLLNVKKDLSVAV